MIENPNLANERIKYNSVEDLLIDELNIGIALIESYIEENAYIYVFVAPGGGSKGGLASEVKVPDMINVHLTNLISQLLTSLDYHHVYCTPLMTPIKGYL